MSKLVEAAAEFLARDTSTKQTRRDLEQINENASKASKILKTSWASAGNNTGMHRRSGDSINVDYTTNKTKAEMHANKHVELLSKHGIKSEPRITRSERQGTPFYYHGVTVKESDNTSTKQTKSITEAEYHMPYSSKTSDPPDVRYKNVIAHAKKMGYNVHHNEHMGDDKSGNKGSPDITFHYERGDHRNNADPASIEIHSGNASNDSTLKALAKGKSK